MGSFCVEPGCLHRTKRRNRWSGFPEEVAANPVIEEFSIRDLDKSRLHGAPLIHHCNGVFACAAGGGGTLVGCRMLASFNGFAERVAQRIRTEAHSGDAGKHRRA